MAKRDRRSRALLRNLRKQARKGQLTAREKKDLLQQESRFREARRASAPYMGAGLAGAAALLGTPAGQSILENVAGGVRGLRQDALGARENRKTFKEQSQQERDIMAAETEQEIAEAQAKKEQAFNEVREAAKDNPALADTPGIETDPQEDPYREGREAFESVQPELERLREEERLRERMQRAEELGSQVTNKNMAIGPVTPFIELDAMNWPNLESDTIDRALMADEAGRNQLDYTGGFSDPVDVDALRRGEVLPSQDRRGLPAGPSREEFDMLQAEAGFSDPAAMGAARAMSRDAAADFGRAQFDRAQRILSGELTGDPFIDLGVQPMDLAEEEDIDEPRYNQRERALMAREAARARNRARRRGEDGIPLREQSGPRVQAQGGRNPKMQDLMKRIARKYGIK